MSVGVLFPGQGSQHVGMGPTSSMPAPTCSALAPTTCSASPSASCASRGQRRSSPAPSTPSLPCSPSRTHCGTNSPVRPGWSRQARPATRSASTPPSRQPDSSTTTLRSTVVAKRGRAMASAASRSPSGMAALLGADEELADSVCEQSRAQGGALQVANVNAPGQVVVAGSASDIDWLVANSADLGVRRVIPLKVSGAFHSSFMEPAATRVGERPGAGTGVASRGSRYGRTPRPSPISPEKSRSCWPARWWLPCSSPRPWRTWRHPGSRPSSTSGPAT